MLMIQSVYRGFEVRKYQSLMKLRQIAQVGKQVVELRNRIQDLASSMDDKQKLIIGETIMSLLLKLDTIQGLHPIMRDVRKFVAKELVDLQEKLDSLTFPQVESQNEEKNGELNNDHEVEAANPIHAIKPEQLVEQISDELNKDHVQAQSGSNDEVVRLDLENH
ncbi:unnamed protein product [Lactuca virosa]|uniref:BAG domain-containing protein n=1 Tax=Lactuca virosa TaxID=75947 RepID=A0AAU9NKF8_9ASTR|nr:unnamed protein product [Lactuca virosa]